MKVSPPIYRLIRGIIALLAVLIIGTSGYRIIEGWSFVDSLYMTVITISTVGYAELHPLSIAGRIFNIVLIFGGVGTLLYILNNIVRYFLEGEFGIGLGGRRMETKISKLHNHYILCGFGRVGQGTANSLSQENVEFVVIEQDKEGINKALEANYLVIHDDATRNEVLKRAGIERAKGLIAALGNDADNTYTILAARNLNSTLSIIARASDDEAKSRLQQAGADHIVAPEVIGGQRMARLAIRPSAIRFIETVFSSHDEAVLIEDIKVNEDSLLLGETIEQIEYRFPRIKILALKKEGHDLTINPNYKTVIDKDSILTAFGPYEQLQYFAGCCGMDKHTAIHVNNN